jgi:hypothetical protein
MWNAEDAAGSREDLTLLRLNENERLVIPFTITMVRVLTHYADFPEVRGYVRCNGPDCVLCRVGRQQEVRDLLPVYDVLDQSVVVLAISLNVRPQALRPALRPVLQRVAKGEGPLVLSLRKEGYRYLVGVQPLPTGADDGAAVIDAFREKFDAGEIDLAGPFPALDNATLAGINSVRILMIAKGIEG